MKSKKLKTMSAALIIWGVLTPLKAAQEINPTQVLGVVIANQGLTRISVEADAITDVFVYPQELQNHLQLHQSGHVFIAPDGLTKPLYVTVMTKRGQTQDLKITLANKGPKPLILKAKPKRVTAEEIESWFKEFSRGIVPLGFHTMTLTEQPRSIGAFRLEPQEAFRNATHEMTLYALSVRSGVSSSLTVNPADLCRNGEAAHVLAPTLEPGAVTKLLILKPLGD